MKSLPILVLILTSLAPGVPIDAQGFLVRHRMTPFDRGSAIAWGDFDEDGCRDLLLGRGVTLVVAPNDGTGRFRDGAFQASYASGLGTRGLLVGHFGGDSGLDGFAWGQTGSARGFEGDSLGGLQEKPVIHPTVNSNSPSSQAAADIDGDGLDDVFFADGGVLVLWHNQGQWNFNELPLPSFAGTVADILLEDFDGDGDLDLLQASNSLVNPANQLFLNDGAGAFNAVDTALDDSLLRTQCVASVDFDGDGDMDVHVGNAVLAGSGDPIHQVFRNDGGLVFIDLSSALPPASDFTFCLSAVGADLDGDSSQELVFVQNDNAIDSFMFQAANGTFQRSSIQTPNPNWFPQGLLAADVDRDGDIDLLVPNDGAPRLFANDGSGFLTDLEPEGGLFLDRPTANAVFDADNDGTLDLLLAMAAGDAELLAGSPTGEFTAGLAQLPAYSQGAADLAVGDLDSDGDEDAVLSGSLRIMENTGRLVFVDAPARLGGTTISGLGLELGDFDQDGDLDLLVGTSLPGGTTLLRNDGLGFFAIDPAAVQNSAAIVVAIESGDLDGDGDLDAILCAESQTRSELLLNGLGAVLTASAGPFPFDGYWATDAELFDADQDGDLDVYFSQRGSGVGINTISAPDAFYLNDGSASFSAAPSQIPPDWRTTAAVTSIDADQDGDLDLALLEAYGIDPVRLEDSPDQVRILLNDGSGSFLSQDSVNGGALLSLSIQDGGGALTRADVDGDGDADLVCESRVLVNLSLQLHVAQVPRLGQRLDIEGYAAPGAQILLGASLGETALPLGALGLLRLDPSTAIVITSGNLDPQGKSTYSVPVPSTPSLLGFTTYWQALVTSPTHLTGAERVTLTDL